MRRRLALGAVRLALPLWRILRARDRRAGGRGVLLAEARARTVVLVRCLGVADAAARVEANRDLIGLFDLAVIVLDDWAAAARLAALGQVEVLPDAGTRARFLPDVPWEAWQARRLADIRHDWAPDFELTLGP